MSESTEPRYGRIVPRCNPDVEGDVPTDFDQFWSGDLEFDQLPPEARAQVEAAFRRIEERRQERGP